MIGKFIIAVAKVLGFWLVHVILMLISLALAVIFAILFWIIWLFVRWIKKPASKVKLEPAEFGFERPVEELIGIRAGGSVDSVFEGGGVKALAQIGSVQAVERLGLRFGLLGGTSGGAIIAAALATGKNADDIWELLNGKGLHSIVSVWYLPQIEFLQKKIYFYLPLLANLVINKGMISGKKFHQMMTDLIGEKTRFRDIPNPEWETDKNEPEYTLKMVATDISRGIPVVLPDDLPDYWESWDEAAKHAKGKLSEKDAKDWWSIADAVRMSMSIPFFFTPVKVHLNEDGNGKVKRDGPGKKGRPVYIVDGGICSNFPIWLFDRLDTVPCCPTFGFLLDEKKGQPAKYAQITGLLIDLAVAVISTGMGAMDKRLSKHDNYRTARLGTSIEDKKIGTTSFGLSTGEQMELVSRGVTDTVDFLNRFKWDEYINMFRKTEEGYENTSRPSPDSELIRQ